MREYLSTDNRTKILSAQGALTATLLALPFALTAAHVLSFNRLLAILLFLSALLLPYPLPRRFPRRLRS